MTYRTPDWFSTVRILLVAAIVLWAIFATGRVFAATITGSFTLPSTYVDNSPLPVANIRQVRVRVATCNAGAVGTVEGTALVAPPATTFSITVPRAFGNFCVDAQLETTTGKLSDFTVPVIKTIDEPKPNPPVLTVTTATTAYELRPGATGVFNFVAVGTVPLKRVCGPRIVGKYAAITGAKLTKPVTGGIIAAKCAAV
jgi:hypothetical protein